MVQKLFKEKKEWEAFKKKRYTTLYLHDDIWGGSVLTQPSVIKAATVEKTLGLEPLAEK